MQEEKNLILKDYNEKRKKYNTWRDKKVANLKLAEAYKRLSNGHKDLSYYRKFERCTDCGTFLEFKVYEDAQKLLNSANFCHIRLCPMCAWRRSLKIFGQVSKIMNEFEVTFKNYSFLFLTLTIKNCSSDELQKTITNLFYAFNKLMKRKKVKKSVVAYFRGLEITYNVFNDEYHPHIHTVLAVPDGYFFDKTKYISQEEFTDFWQKSLNIDYKPIVDVRKITNKAGGVCEISKYSVKPSDYLSYVPDIADKVIKTLDVSLANRRLFAFGGEFKKLHKALNLDDAIDGDLVKTDNEEVREDVGYLIEVYKWNIGLSNYVLYENK